MVSLNGIENGIENGIDNGIEVGIEGQENEKMGRKSLMVVFIISVISLISIKQARPR